MGFSMYIDGIYLLYIGVKVKGSIWWEGFYIPTEVLKN